MLYNMSFAYLLSYLIGATITITVHEFVKAFVSDKLGDPLPQKSGRITMNPLKHIEPIGFIVMAACGFGWGKPVDTATIYYKDRKKGTIITYTLPSVANLLLGLILIPFLALVTNPWANTILNITIMLNLRHALFNIVPVFPMDGAKVLTVIRDPNQVIRMANNEMLYQIVLITFIGMGIVARIIDPICWLLITTISGIF